MMTFEHIKNLLQLSCDFNSSSISHSFTVDKGDILKARCIKDTFIFEVTSTTNQQVEYYLSVDEAAEALYKKITPIK